MLHSDKSEPNWSNLLVNVTAHSKYPGGVNAMFSDGHIQFIKNANNLGIWQVLGSLNGGRSF